MSTDWIPFELMNAGPRSLVRWIHPGTEPLFQEPFFGQSVEALVNAHAPQKLTPIDDLAGVPSTRAPQGFIFHVSRCGSTLVSRSLAAVPRYRVISEAAPVNQLLLAGHDPVRLKGLLHALCGTAPDTSCIIKFTSWNLLFLEQILALFPSTPWVFVYRDPADVVQSLLARPPRWAGNTALSDKPDGSAAEQMIGILERLFSAPLPHLGPLAKVVNYSQLPGAIREIAAHFGLQPDADELARIAAMAQFDAKQPGKTGFQARDSAPLTEQTKHALVPLDLLYRQWERKRT